MSRWRTLLWPGIASLIALAILLGLGAWQMQRKGEKERILAALESAVTAPPLVLDSTTLAALRVASAGAAAQGNALPELTRVTIRGTYRQNASIPVRATLPASSRGVPGGIGFFWMTPLSLDDGLIVFVNRGFVPSGGDWRAPAIAAPDGPQTIVGLLRAPEARQTFTPDDIPARREFFARDPATMAAAARLRDSRFANLFIDAERIEGDLRPPVGVEAREMIARIPNNHLQYAVTWFGLALTLIGVFAAFAWSRLRSPAEPA